jgi:hypothetical protein
MGADFLDADLASTQLVRLVRLDAAKNFEKARNLNRALRE